VAASIPLGIGLDEDEDEDVDEDENEDEDVDEVEEPCCDFTCLALEDRRSAPPMLDIVAASIPLPSMQIQFHLPSMQLPFLIKDNHRRHCPR
jgi:hypothetical protein